MDTLDDDWELDAETAHPNAAALLKEPYFWDVYDENSPFGNEHGADALAFYRAALLANPDLDSAEFLDELFEAWDIDADFAKDIPDDELVHRLEREHSHILTYDDVVVAVAFAEVVLRGSASSDIAAAAIKSLKRQALPDVLDFRGWSDPELRQERCLAMESALLEAT